MNYWPQQLNFAVWCATTGCGISSKLLFEDEKFSYIPKIDGELKLPNQVRSFLWFHVYFTVRRILHEMGGIQNSVALPGDDAFDQKKNPCDIPSYKRLCNEFGISPSTDFRFNHGMNHGLVMCTFTTLIWSKVRRKLLILELTSSVMKVAPPVMVT